jgi:hypothetical protein
MKDLVPVERIVRGIYLIRDKKVMMDRDLTELYGVDTAQLKRAVKRNIERFSPDFMLELTKQELEDWRCQFGTSNGTRMGLRYLPMAFTEQGVAMLSSVLSNTCGMWLSWPVRSRANSEQAHNPLSPCGLSAAGGERARVRGNYLRFRKGSQVSVRQEKWRAEWKSRSQCVLWRPLKGASFLSGAKR